MAQMWAVNGRLADEATVLESHPGPMVQLVIVHRHAAARHTELRCSHQRDTDGPVRETPNPVGADKPDLMG